jgi:hypothetical protein
MAAIPMEEQSSAAFNKLEALLLGRASAVIRFFIAVEVLDG